MKGFASPTFGHNDREVLGGGSDAREMLGMPFWSRIAITHIIATQRCLVCEKSVKLEELLLSVSPRVNGK